MRKFTIIAVVLLLLLALGVTFAFAQTDEPEVPSDQPSVESDHPKGLLAQIFDRETMQATLAAALGLTVDELEAARADGVTIPELAEQQGVSLEDVRAAMEAAKADAVAQAVADGLITEAQGERILSHEGRPRFRGKPGLMAEIFNREDAQAAVADALGMTVAELEAAHENGATIAELAEQQGVSPEEVRAAVETARNEAIDDALASGLITEEQAEMLRDHKGRCRRPHGPGAAPNDIQPPGDAAPASDA